MQKQGLSCHAAYSSEECTQTTETNPPASSLDSRFSNRQMVREIIQQSVSYRIV